MRLNLSLNFRKIRSYQVPATLIFILISIQILGNGIESPPSIARNSGYGFIENHGQLSGDGSFSNTVKYYFQSDNFIMYLTEKGLRYKYFKAVPSANTNKDKTRKSEFSPTGNGFDVMKYESAWIDVELMDMANDPRVYGRKERNDRIHFYNSGLRDIRHFNEIVFEDVYTGIDWVIRLDEKQLKYDFIVDPGVDPNQIQMIFHGADEVKESDKGGYTASCPFGAISESAPVGFQAGKEIQVSFDLSGDTLGFQLGKYDAKLELIIDPELTWSTYYGGTENELPYAVVEDENGNVYMAGSTYSFTNIASGGHQNEMGNTEYYYSDAMLIKFNSAGDRIWSTYYGGVYNDAAHDLDLDDFGNIYMAGFTESMFGDISTAGAHQESTGGFVDALLVKFDSDGNRLWATYYGGDGWEEAAGCAVDSENNVYISGRTGSETNIAEAGHQMSLSQSAENGFLAKFSPEGERIWGTYYGTGNYTTFGSDCAVDANDNVFLSGWTVTTSGIAFNGYQNTLASSLVSDAFLVKFSSGGTRLWGTYFGGTGEEYGWGCTTDFNGNIYMTGTTTSSAGIAYNGHQETYGGDFSTLAEGDAFLVKFDENGNLLWSTYYGGIYNESGFTCDTDAEGFVYMGGTTMSPNGIASPGAFYESHGNPGTGLENRDVFLARFSPTGERQWGTYFGTANVEFGGYCHAGANDVIYLALRSNSTSGLAQNGFQNTNPSGGYDAVLAKFNGCGSSSSLSVSSCSAYTWSLTGDTYEESGSYYTVLTSTSGCDSIVNLNLEIVSDISLSEEASACESFTWDENEETYTESGAYQVLYTSAAGCDSSITLNLEIKQSTSTDIFESGCDSYFWEQSNTSYTASGIYEDVVSNQAGCDSLIRLNLTIGLSTASTIAATSCTSYTWDASGDTYTNSGTYTHTLTNEAGCDSTISLDLQINEADLNSQTQEVCDSIFWETTGEWIYSSGQYSSSLLNQNGCDSIVELNLTVNESTFSETNETACESYIWTITGNTYKQTGVFEEELVNEAGCPEYATLNLEILNTYTSQESVSACEEFNWEVNGESYNQSGVYTDTLQALNGCDSILTLDLTIADITTELVTACEPYYWAVSDEIYSESGTYTVQFINEGSCDSILQLDLNYDPVLITEHPENVATQTGQIAEFTISSSSPADEFRWQKLENGVFEDLAESDKYTGTTNPKLRIQAVTWTDINDVFRCQVFRNNCHTISESAELTVLTAEPVLFPNPSDGRFTLAVPEDLVNTEAVIYDELGKLIFIQSIQTTLTSFNLENLAMGNYQMLIDGNVQLRFIIVK